VHARKALIWWIALIAAASAACGPAAVEEPLILIDGRPAHLEAAPLVRGGEALVWLRDLAAMGFGSARWDASRERGALAAPAVALEFEPGSRKVTVSAVGRDGSESLRTEVMSEAAVLADGRLMVPLTFVCEQLGVSSRVRSRLVVNVGSGGAGGAGRSGGLLSQRDQPAAGAKGAISGKVVSGGVPLAGIVLRLVRASDSTFVPNRRAVSGVDGRYRFPGVPDGRYRVYAYVGDNPDYFNRETATVTVAGSGAEAQTISMGRVLRPLAPDVGARVGFGEHLTFAWTECPGASSYEFSAVDPESAEEVAFRSTEKPTTEVAGRGFTLGRVYHWRVLALNADGDLLGATPGRGAPPWSFAVVFDGGTRGP
jgi:hypothetical protein